MNQHPLRSVIPARLAHWLPLFVFALASTAALAQRGRIELGQITSDALANNLLGDKTNRPYRVYLPPGYDLTTNRYPVLYVLHGYTQDGTALVSTVQNSMDSLIRQRKIGEMIAVFVDGANRLKGSWYLSSPVIGDYETYITHDLVNLIDNRYRTLTSRESRGITGFSMGGWGTMHLAFKFPEVFSVAVAESGLYDARGKLNDGLERQFASLHPTNLTQFDAISFPVNSVAALFAGLAPNLQRPSLYTDYPYERVNGQLVLVDSVDQLALAGDVQHGDLERYLQQPLRLNGIRVVHGISDPLVPIAEARQFTNTLVAAGLEFEYQEHSGGHEYRPDLALPFLSTHLHGAELYAVPPRLGVSYATNTVQLTFPTQAGVEYRIESSSALEAPVVNWSEKSRIVGNGLPSTTTFPLDADREFFRVRAANVDP